LVVLNLNLQILVFTQVILILDREESRFFESILSVGDELPQEHLFVGVQTVNDDIHQPTDFLLELVLLPISGHFLELVLGETINLLLDFLVLLVGILDGLRLAGLFGFLLELEGLEVGLGLR